MADTTAITVSNSLILRLSCEGPAQIPPRHAPGSPSTSGAAAHGGSESSPSQGTSTRGSSSPPRSCLKPPSSSSSISSSLKGQVSTSFSLTHDVVELGIDVLKSEKSEADLLLKSYVDNLSIMLEGEQKIQRECTKHALDLFYLIEPEDQDVRNSCEPKLGRETVEFSNVTVASKDLFRKETVLGSGSFSTMKRCLVAGSSVVVKAVPEILLREKGKKDMFDTEVKMAERLLHPNIVAFQSIVWDQGMLCLIMHDAGGGDLFDRISASRLPVELCHRFIFQMLSGLAYCHQLKICHRDIRPENYCLSNENGKQHELKLVDFSLARINEDGDTMRTMVGCMPYVAPEVIKGKYDKKCDVWSVGVVSFLITVHQLPIFEDDPKRCAQRIADADLRMTPTLGLDRSLQALLLQMLTKDAAMRKNASTICGNKWLRKKAGVQIDGCCALA